MAAVYRRQLAYLAICLFFFFSSIACLIPFLTLQMRHLGLNIEETAMINMAAGFISILGAPFAGAFSHLKAKYKLVTVMFMVLAGVAYTCLLFVPPVTRMPRKPLTEFDCGSAVRIEKCENWKSCEDIMKSEKNSTTFQISHCDYHCPDSVKPNASYPLHVCFHDIYSDLCVVYDPDLEPNSTVKFQSRLSNWKSEILENVDPSEFLHFEPNTHKELVDVCVFHPTGGLFVDQKEYHGIGCRPLPEDCSIKCNLWFDGGRSVSKSTETCLNEVGDPVITFWAYLGIRAFADLCLMIVICLLDALTIISINDFEGAYGGTRIWPALALAAFPPITGVLVDYYHEAGGQNDYTAAVIMFDGLALLSCILIIAIPIKTGKKKNYFEALGYPYVGHHFCSVEMVILLFVVLVLGTQWGLLETFATWFYMDIGCSSFSVGLTYTVAFGASLPFLLISKHMVRNIGRANLLVFAFLFYGTRYAGESFITSSWWTLPFAAMEAFSLCVMWISAVAYGQNLAPRNLRLVIQYILNLTHFGVGRGLGSYLGGLFISIFGIRRSFCGVALFSTAMGLLYLTFYHSLIKKRKRVQKKTTPVMMNGSWYPLGEQHPNGDAKAHRPIIADQDETQSLTSGNDCK